MSYTHNGHQAAHDDIRELQEKVVEGRREFFKQVGQGAVATAVATTAMHMGTREFMKPVVDTAGAHADPHGGWKNLFSLKPNYLYMNIGTTGSTPTQVLDQYEHWYNEVAWRCQAYGSTKAYCTDVASAFGANPSELIMSFTTSDGMAKTLQGVKWAEDGEKADNVITTNMEHSGGLGPLYCQINRHNVNTPTYNLKFVDRLTGANAAAGAANAIPAVEAGEMVLVPTGVRKNPAEKIGYPAPGQNGATHPDDYLFQTMIKPGLDEALRQLGTAKMFMFSSPTYLIGVRYPEKQMCKWCADRGIISSIDGAHLPGMINVNFHDMGVDLFAGSGHKWQCGPGQTGIAYIRNGKTGDEKWTFNGQSGTAPAYTNATRPPLYWAGNDTFRMSKYTDAASTVLRPMVNGMRRPEDNIGALVQSIGNNSIPLTRASYECMKLWNTIGRQNIEDYVVTLAQYLRFNMITNAAFDGNVAENALYALGAEVRKNNKVPSALTWDDMWKPSDAQCPVYVKCGLTSWNPMYYNGGVGLGAPDYNFPMSAADRTVQRARSSAILTYWNTRHGVFARNTTAPVMLRFPNAIGTAPVLAANAKADVEGLTGSQPVNAAHPFRISTHLFHDMTDIDTFIAVASGAKEAAAGDMLNQYNLGATQ